MDNQCKICKSYLTKNFDNIFFCLSCNSYYSESKKNFNIIKNFSNKEAHFKNIIKILNNLSYFTIKKEIIYEIKNKMKNVNLDRIDSKFLNAFLKSNKIIDKKNYILYYLIICNLKNENPILDSDTLEIITIIFYNFINFMAKNNRIDETISYQLLLNNILDLFNITKNFNINITNIKDKKTDIWNKYVVYICTKYLTVTPNFKRKKLYFNKQEYLEPKIKLPKN